MSKKAPSTVGSLSWNADELFQPLGSADPLQVVHESLRNGDFRGAVIAGFNLPMRDNYTYHASASVTLDQVQAAINAGRANGLCDWYQTKFEEEDQVKTTVRYPEMTDVFAYIGLFDPSKPVANLLKGFKANAKKGSLRAGIAEHLSSKRYVDPGITIPKSKKGHANIYADFWAWSCKALSWAGPDALCANIHQSHHVLPVFMHHFGCVCPSYESLEIIKLLSKARIVLDIGSGNGYWTYMLRRHGVDVLAVDNLQSVWRTMWIGDTVREDGIKYIKKRSALSKDDVLLLVYPVVGLDFTTGVLDAYKGDLICVAGTQNGNGYTGFKNEMVDSWMARERADFEKIVQVPLPSFAGKDDALFVFRRKSSAFSTTQA